jgi:hypothetical protein
LSNNPFFKNIYFTLLTIIDLFFQIGKKATSDHEYMLADVIEKKLSSDKNKNNALFKPYPIFLYNCALYFVSETEL